VTNTTFERILIVKKSPKSITELGDFCDNKSAYIEMQNDNRALSLSLLENVCVFYVGIQIKMPNFDKVYQLG